MRFHDHLHNVRTPSQTCGTEEGERLVRTTVAAAYDPKATVARGLDLARRAYARLDPGGDDGLGRVRVYAHDGASSYYNKVTGSVHVGTGGEAAGTPSGRLELLETTLHEVTHRWTDRRAGFSGLLYAYGPGRISEGLSQVMAGAILVLEGTPDEQAHGWHLLDPRGKTATLASSFGGPGRQVPLSVTMDDVRRTPFSPVDAGYVHVHSGVVQAAHLDMARDLGMEPMARITTTAARDGLHQLTGFRSWANATIEAAGKLHGVGSREQDAVRQAWLAAKVLLPR